jgi:hypothetical protein
MRLVIQPRPADVRGRGVLKELFLDRVPVELVDGAQPPGHGGAGTAPCFQLPELTYRLDHDQKVLPADSRVRTGSEIVVLRCAREPATGVASLSHRGGTAWPILTAEARCWILTRTLR